MKTRHLLLAALALASWSCSEDTRPSSDGPKAGDNGTTDIGTTTDADLGVLADHGISDGVAEGAVTDGTAADGPVGPANPCPALPAPGGTQIKVTPSQVGQLSGIVYNAQPNTTILLEDGTYALSGSQLHFTQPNVTLRSASGDRDKVIIDGEYNTNEIALVQANNVTIADLTLRRAVNHLVHATGSGSATIKNTLLYNLKLIDAGEQFVKVNSDGNQHYVDDGRLECSELEMTAQGRTHVETNPGGCYTGGIDAHGAWGWQVRFNTIKGIYCDNGSLAEHAVHFWSASRATLVERNVIVDCARGIGLGLGNTGADRVYPDDPYPSVGYIGHIDGIVRNNVIHASPAMAQYFDTGIELNQAHGSVVYHNTVVSKPTFSSIDYRFANTQVEIRNNLTSVITVRDGAQGTVDHNLEGAAAALFVDAAAVNYHLQTTATAAIDKGIAVAEAGLDLDGMPHTVGPPDLGAYERQP
jgi:hypothetical protein